MRLGGHALSSSFSYLADHMTTLVNLLLSGWSKVCVFMHIGLVELELSGHVFLWTWSCCLDLYSYCVFLGMLLSVCCHFVYVNRVHAKCGWCHCKSMDLHSVVFIYCHSVNVPCLEDLGYSSLDKPLLGRWLLCLCGQPLNLYWHSFVWLSLCGHVYVVDVTVSLWTCSCLWCVGPSGHTPIWVVHKQCTAW